MDEEVLLYAVHSTESGLNVPIQPYEGWSNMSMIAEYERLHEEAAQVHQDMTRLHAQCP